MEARDIILAADRVARSKGLTQQQWSKEAGLDDNGTCISRTLVRGNCKLSTILMMLRALGFELVLIEKGAVNGEKQG